MRKDKILSIQSKLIYGYVGSNVAELAIQLHGFDVISFPTVYLAAHTQHRPIYGTAIAPELFADFIIGINNLNILKDVPCAITGYIGSIPILKQISDYIGELKKNYSDITYICDPVMGDVETGLYVSKDVCDHIEHTLLPKCDIMTPNFFEFEYLAGQKIHTIEDIKNAVNTNRLLSDRSVIITSCMLEDTPPNTLETIILTNKLVERICTERVNIETTGTGDFFTSLLATQLAKNVTLINAVKYASHTISIALAHTLENKKQELNAESILFSISKNK